MKKQIKNFENSALSRKEMKSFNGGWVQCKTGNCAIYTKMSGGGGYSRPGVCTLSNLGSFSHPFMHCYCNTGGGPIATTSASHCNV
jgi:hypothetical protein